MSIYRHIPAPPLSQYVDFCWYYVDLSPDHDREHVLPDGTFELIVNLQETPRKLFHGANSATYDAFEQGWISGAHSKFLVIDALPRSSMIGVHFKPGGAAAFLGVPGDELAGQVVELDAVWGGTVWDWRDQCCSHTRFKIRYSRTPSKSKACSQQIEATPQRCRRLGARSVYGRARSSDDYFCLKQSWV